MIDDLRSVISKVFGVKKEAITTESSPETIARWDSLTHLILIHEIEKKFGINIATKEAIQFKNVAAIMTLLEQKGLSK